MDCFKDVATGMEMANINDTIKIKHWIDGFVDDTSIFTNQDSNNNDPTTIATTLYRTMQANGLHYYQPREAN